jgi:hypothetical protein
VLDSGSGSCGGSLRQQTAAVTIEGAFSGLVLPLLGSDQRYNLEPI